MGFRDRGTGRVRVYIVSVRARVMVRVRASLSCWGPLAMAAHGYGRHEHSR